MPTPSDATLERRLAIGTLLLFGLVALMAMVDLSTDVGGGVDLWHVLVEGTVALAGLLGAALATKRLLMSRQEAVRRTQVLSADLEQARREVTRYREEAQTLLRGLSEVIDRELDRWGLTGAEKEVALLLLKGLSHKEIGAVRSVSEATARQQARAVYRKAGVAGRSELAAHFLEDLMLPASDTQLDRPS